MTISSNELLDAASKMPLDEKLKLYDTIKDEITQYRIEQLFDEMKSDDISYEEISDIVENVRSERYKNRS